MKKLRYQIPLVVVVASIVAAILIIAKPFAGGDSSEGTSDNPAVVVDARQGSGAQEENPLIATGDQAALLPTAKPQAGEITPTPKPKRAKGPLAAEVVGINAWINSQPLMIADLKGKVVLVDFWTYTCVNCIRTFPYLKVWHAKYADDGLVILGVHTPEFNFEKNLENVREAVEMHSIGWPVALDNEYATWNAYRNRYWPAKYLIDKDGVIRYTHFGEGAYIETESKIRELLEEAGADLLELDFDLPNNQPLDPMFLRAPSGGITRELYGGHERGYRDVMISGGYVKHTEYYAARDRVTDYEDPGDHERHVIYLQGPWYNGSESLRHGRETSNFEDYIFLDFSATSVNAVFRPEGEGAGPYEVLVTLDGNYLDDSNKGEDVVIEEDGRSFVPVNGPRMYSIIQAPHYGRHELKLSSNSPHFALFAFTFGVYESGI